MFGLFKQLFWMTRSSQGNAQCVRVGAPHSRLFRWHLTGCGNGHHTRQGLGWALTQGEERLLQGFREVRLLWPAPYTGHCELAFGDSPMGVQLPPEKGFTVPGLRHLLNWLDVSMSSAPHCSGMWWVREALSWERKTAKGHWQLFLHFSLRPLKGLKM